MSRSSRWGEPQSRAIAAARELAEEGGYDAVQIRDVVARTGLSSATIYRHFSSKDHLIAAAQLEWNRTLPALRRKLPAHGTAADRVAELVHRSCVAFGRSPNLAKALLLALGTSDEGVRACQQEAHDLFFENLRAAAGDAFDDPDSVLQPLAFAYYGGMQAWANDRLSIGELDEILQETTRLLFAGAESSVSGRARKLTRGAS